MTLDRLMQRSHNTSTADLLAQELAAVTGDRCAWTCDDHHGDNFPPCERAAGHASAQLLADVHVVHGPDGQLVIATECCPSGGA
jgi:hypothetical protein